MRKRHLDCLWCQTWAAHRCGQSDSPKQLPLHCQCQVTCHTTASTKNYAMMITQCKSKRTPTRAASVPYHVHISDESFVKRVCEPLFTSLSLKASKYYTSVLAAVQRPWSRSTASKPRRSTSSKLHQSFPINVHMPQYHDARSPSKTVSVS